MINISEKKTCCGCGACTQACIRGCISMQEDAEGFLYPEVDPERCVRCGRCVEACPVERKNTAMGEQKMVAYAAWAKDEALRRESSSGGIFSLLAQWVLKQSGVVFGAAFADDFSVRHIRIECLQELPLLRGSKYLQSRTENTFSEVKAALKEGRIVLYTGTSCQIAGLKQFLGREYDNLYTVDVICHGVPSPKIWKMYLDSQKACTSADVQEAYFRRKNQGWKAFSMELVFSDGARYSKTLKEDPFLKIFLRDICLRPSCYACQFKGLPRASDLTLGDAWEIHKVMPDMDDDKGTSLVLLHTKKGRALWEAIEPQTYSCIGDAEALLQGNKAFGKSARIHPRRKKFFEAVNSGASMDVLERLSKKTVTQRIRSLGGRCIRKLKRTMKAEALKFL